MKQTVRISAACAILKSLYQIYRKESLNSDKFDSAQRCQDDFNIWIFLRCFFQG